MKKYLIIYFLLFLFLLVSCISDRKPLPIPKTDNEKSIVRLVAVGDNLIHSSVYQSAKIGDSYDFKPMYTEIKPYIQSFDLAFINQETILGGSQIGLSSYPRFNSPFELGDALVDTGFNLISIANNHTLDRGEIGVKNAIEYWESQPIVYSGATLDEMSSQMKVFEKNGILFAFIAYTYGTNGIPHPEGKFYLANIYSNEKAKKDIDEIRDLVDVIIVSMHWGQEYQNLPSATQKEQAYFLANLGVDIIIGHHPHVIQPIDVIEENEHRTIVIYSLGNFLSDQQGIDRLIGLATSIQIEKEIKENQAIITFNNLEAKLLYRYKNVNQNIFRIKTFETLSNLYLMDFQYYFDKKRELLLTYYDQITIT